MSSSNISPFRAVVIILAAAGLGVGGGCSSQGTSTQGIDQTVSVTGGDATAQATEATAPPTTVSLWSADIDDAIIEAALAQAATSPLEGLPSRDEVATVRLIDQFEAAGYDLDGLGFSIYPASSADSFVLLETSDSTPLLESEAGETFITDLLGSPILSEYEVERLVLQHTTIDEEGLLVVTMTILVSDFKNAIETDDDNVFELFAIQTERR